ncbi:hypothetical protein DUNSADRAFT_9010 [Dunaliella salina]|uniref:Uncharacterized protein n=1 Tax=Dunaliella salina TaxID=3046 RepID=A0ABZ3KYU9_DUNSA|nr:hypothetical protein DUNSADRAFT_9010 [Dunaliella salina]|eukprot:KAF5834347.1 hypothetical protein DUNSADRAFT_9010 [Dunaliella salina]
MHELLVLLLMLLLPMNVLLLMLPAWLDCISDSLYVLRSAHVLRFHTALAGACLDPGARYLEAMTARLISVVDQLLTPFERSMPHAATIPTQPLGAGSSGAQQGNGAQGSQPDGLLSMLLSAAGLVSGGTATASTSSGNSGSSGNNTTLVRLHSRVQSAFKRFYGSGKHDHHNHQQQEQQQNRTQQQEQGKDASDADGREEDANARVQTPQPPPHKCPLLVVEPPPSAGSNEGDRILEQLVSTVTSSCCRILADTVALSCCLIFPDPGAVRVHC